MKQLSIFALILLCGCMPPAPPKAPPQSQEPSAPRQQDDAPPLPSVPSQNLNKTYDGTWVTTNRPLQGKMKCDVIAKDDTRWTGHFYGVWMGRKFDYTVDWTGTPDRLQGTATIDGARYQWTGEITPTSFRGTFTGSRYTGSFNLSTN